MPFFIKYLLPFCAIFMLARCANQQTLTGGPKDETPPKLLAQFPADQSTNYRGALIRFEFDEWVAVQNLQKELLIAPLTEVTYKHTVKKNVVEIKFDSALAPNTTYILNFQGAIVDITEKNKAEQIILAFSTGNQLDSLKISGKVSDWLTQLPAAETSVMLFTANDTLLLDGGKPMYLVNTDAQGGFSFGNLRAGTYQLLALKEPKQTANLKYSRKRDESVAFLSAPIELKDSNLDSISLGLMAYDYQKLTLQKARQNKQYFEFAFSKPIKGFRLDFPESVGKILPKKNKEILRLFNATGAAIDSFQVQLHAFDSVGNVIDSLCWVSFEVPKRPATEGFEANLLPNAKMERVAADSARFHIAFTKPVASFNPDSCVLYVQTDTLPWPAQVLPQFSIFSDTLHFVLPPTENHLRVVFKAGAFISLEKDTLKPLEMAYELLDQENYGVVTGQIESWKTNYTIQLLNENGEIEHEAKNQRSFIFVQVKPGKKQLRILIDDNDDGQWSAGDYRKRQLPERVFIYTNDILVKANWEIQLEAIAF